MISIKTAPTPVDLYTATALLTASPLQDYLRDPWGTIQAVLSHLHAWVITWGPMGAPLTVIGDSVLLL
ncbi:MAG TPA: hypothetical protein VFQ77_00290, partial [Pseudonocardiaceae bacterium]|nr:hypothetical protein [Pseudonocardiaceae bacterium]